MSLIAEFTIPAEALPGGDTLANLPNTRIELDRIVPTREAMFPFFWVFGAEADEFLRYADEEPELSGIEVISTVRNGALFRAEWSPDAEVIEAIKAMKATIVEGVGTPGEWHFRLRADDRSGIAQFQEIFTSRDVPVHLKRLYSLAELVEGEHHSLTPEQRETLVAAYRRGYFDEPRKVTQAQLGEEFAVSGRAISKRLRRGIRNLVANTILAAPSSVDDSL